MCSPVVSGSDGSHEGQRCYVGSHGASCGALGGEMDLVWGGLLCHELLGVFYSTIFGIGLLGVGNFVDHFLCLSAGRSGKVRNISYNFVL